MIISIYSNDGLLCWDNQYPLATKDEYMEGDRSVGSIFEALNPEEVIELSEGILTLDEDLDPQPLSDAHSVILESALEEGKNRHPNSPVQHHAAFANSVAYLMTGMSGGYGGPSVREHSVSWALSGAGGKQQAMQTNIGQIVLQIPDGTLKNAGKWSYGKALEFAEPLCYGELTELHQKCFKQEHCFDDAPEDIEALKKLSGSNESQ